MAAPAVGAPRRGLEPLMGYAAPVGGGYAAPVGGAPGVAPPAVVVYTACAAGAPGASTLPAMLSRHSASMVTVAALGFRLRTRRNRRLGRMGRQAKHQAACDYSGGAAAAGPGMQASWSPPNLVAAAVVGKKKKLKVATAQQLVQRIFIQGSKSAFSPNSWYEAPEIGVSTSQARVWQNWQVRPTRNIDRMSEGTRTCGCTWSQLDGRRGASFIRFNDDGKVSFVREIVEPEQWRKFKENNMSSLGPLFGVMGAIQNTVSVFGDYLTVDREKLKPRLGLAKPKTRRATDVVRYLWEEAFCAEDNAIDKVMAEYSETAVFDDMTYAEEVRAKGKKAVREYLEETKENAPETLRFILDEVSDGIRSCAALWHIEFGGQKSPRGVSFYELDEAGKVEYVCASYDITF